MACVECIFTGAAPLGAETADEIQKIYPSWKVRQGYGKQLQIPLYCHIASFMRVRLTATGLTETSTVVSSTSNEDIWFGSSGSLISGVRAKIVSIEGVEITGYDQPGELIVQSPAVVLGYLNNDQANTETFLDDTDGNGRWMRTGDEAVIRKAPSGHEHVFIVDRIKELIKVKVRHALPTSPSSFHRLNDF